MVGIHLLTCAWFAAGQAAKGSKYAQNSANEGECPNSLGVSREVGNILYLCRGYIGIIFPYSLITTSKQRDAKNTQAEPTVRHAKP